MYINESALLTSERYVQNNPIFSLFTSPHLPRGHIAGVAREVSVVVGELNCNIVVVFQPAPMTDQIMIAIRFTGNLR